MKKILGLLLGIFLFFQANAFATMISDESNGYAKAWHDTATWQRLGNSKNVNDGVSWSVNGSAYGNGDLTVGDSVTFKFDFWHQGWGMHSYDQLKVWIDSDSTDGFTGSSVLLAKQHFKKTSGGSNQINNGSTVWTYNPSGAALTAAEENAYTEAVYASLLITSDMIGELFLRARVHCNHTPWDTMQSSGLLTQGEVEDYFIKVAPVPEPATMLLFGFGLLGLAGVSRKKN